MYDVSVILGSICNLANFHHSLRQLDLQYCGNQQQLSKMK